MLKWVWYGLGLVLLLILTIYLSFLFFSNKDFLINKFNFKRGIFEIKNEHPNFSVNLSYPLSKKAVNQELKNLPHPLSKVKLIISDVPQENNNFKYRGNEKIIAYGYSTENLKPGVVQITIYISLDLITFLKEPIEAVEKGLELELYKALYSYQRLELEKTDIIDKENNFADTVNIFNYSQYVQTRSMKRELNQAREWVKRSHDLHQQNLFTIQYE